MNTQNSDVCCSASPTGCCLPDTVCCKETCCDTDETCCGSGCMYHFSRKPVKCSDELTGCTSGASCIEDQCVETGMISRIFLALESHCAEEIVERSVTFTYVDDDRDYEVSPIALFTPLFTSQTIIMKLLQEWCEGTA